eukprot:jgi/Tetstr1/440931/TSEL_029200.t1
MSDDFRTLWGTSIKLALDAVKHQCQQIVWDGKQLVVHELAKPEAINELLQVLQRFEPNVKSLSVTRLQSKNYFAEMKPRPEPAALGSKKFHYMTLEETS